MRVGAVETWSEILTGSSGSAHDSAASADDSAPSAPLERVSLTVEMAHTVAALLSDSARAVRTAALTALDGANVAHRAGAMQRAP